MTSDGNLSYGVSLYSNTQGEMLAQATDSLGITYKGLRVVNRDGLALNAVLTTEWLEKHSRIFLAQRTLLLGNQGLQGGVTGEEACCCTVLTVFASGCSLYLIRKTQEDGERSVKKERKAGERRVREAQKRGDQKADQAFNTGVRVGRAEAKAETSQGALSWILSGLFGHPAKKTQ